MAGKKLSARNVLVLAMGLFVCFWMFVIGVLVGRGTSPVSFDTREFQDSLARIVNGSENQQETFEKPELEFYEVLKSPARTARSTSKTPGEILPAPVEKTPSDTKGGRAQPPVKRSLKARTFRLAKTVKATPPVVSSPKSPKKPAPVPEKKVKKPVRDDGVYTIQIAAYKELKDAKELMDRLRAKGFKSYRTMGRVGNDIWHRVRTGSFKDMASAKQGIQRLGKKRFKGMIIRKE
ncbi:MAG: SPOR domain-containing protein [Desulfobacteraceae bacterium]|nr:SPOR domain-containing protein [Desulfobacteraceae bacterium]